MKTGGLSRFLKDNDNFLIVAHEKPDGDAIGSVLGLCSVLCENGKKAELYFQDCMPQRYKNFDPGSLIAGTVPDLSKYSWILCLDTATAERLDLPAGLKSSIAKYPLVNIDHHPDNKKFGEKNFIFPEAAATSEILYMALRKKMRISQKAAEYFLLGIVMDTGGFRFQNTGAGILRTAAELVEAGAGYEKIMNSMFFSRPLNLIRLEAELISGFLKTEFEGRYAWIYLNDGLLEKHGLTIKDTEAIIDAIRQIAGVEIAVLFYKRDDAFRVSLRSKNEKYSVGEIARALGGGGHEFAAGASIKASTIEEAEKIMSSMVGEKLAKG